MADILQTKNVTKSPFLGRTSSDLSESQYPIDSSPLAEAGENPWGLVRGHTAGNSESRVLFAPPASRFEFDLDLPNDPVLSFGIGIIRDNNSETALAKAGGTNVGIEFIILLEVGGRHRTIFQKQLPLPPRRETRTLNYSQERVEIPVGGRRARLTLLTDGQAGAFALWYSPLLYGRRQARTNIVLVSVDTLRADHVGAYGYERDTTPHLDALAKESALFRNVFATSPWTLPSHVSMMTGLDGLRHGVYYENDRMDPSQPTLAAYLRKEGYACGAVTGGVFVGPSYGFFQGFDSYTIGQGELNDPRLAANAADDTLRWLDAHGDQPFFLFVHTYQVHHPYHSPEEYARKYTGPNPKWLAWDLVVDHGGYSDVFRPLPEAERRDIIGLYDGEIRYTDDALVGPLVERLRSLGVYDRTLLIVTSDHGEEFFEHGGWVHTWSLYNESLAVPLIIKFPGGAYAGQKYDPIVRLTDIVPTVLEILGIDVSAERFDGRSLVQILERREKDDRNILAELAPDVMSHRLPGRVAASAGPDKLILNGGFKKEDLAVFKAPPPDFPPIEFYDLGRDRKEKDNLAGQAGKAEIARSLAAAATAAAQAVKTRGGRTLSKELEDQLRALGYIK